MIPFDADSYARILEAFRRGGAELLPLTHEPPATGRVVLLRHDVDYSLELAVRLAEVNHALGVRGTFFVPVASRLFNPAETTNRGRLQRLLALDQVVGLHVHVPPACVALADAEAEIARDASRLEACLGGGMTAVMSWHDPTTLGAERSAWLRLRRPAGLLNAYALSGDGYEYRSDSNLRHSVEAWLEFAAAGHERVQALFHPFNWTLGAQSSMEGVLAAVLRHLVGELECSLRENRVYSSLLPHGLPDEATQGLVAPLLAAQPERSSSGESG